MNDNKPSNKRQAVEDKHNKMMKPMKESRGGEKMIAV
jgi:hypothetical protein